MGGGDGGRGRRSAQTREGLAGAIWFEEAYVPAAAISDVAAHLIANADEYGAAITAQNSGIVAYINTHADRFIGKLGDAVRAASYRNKFRIS